MPFRLPFPEVGRLGPAVQSRIEQDPVSLVPRWVTHRNGITVNTPLPPPPPPTLVVPPYPVGGRTKSVRGNVTVDTPAVSVITPPPVDDIQSALAALYGNRD